jgi:hypothetical protein
LIPPAALHNTVFFCCELPMHLRLSSPGFGRWARGRYARYIFESGFVVHQEVVFLRISSLRCEVIDRSSNPKV